MEWDGTPYHSLNWEIRKQFGKKLYKISLDGGMTCPNRDGTVGYGGCIFCSEGGSGDFAADRELSVREQLKTAKERIRDKLPKGKPGGYIAYFQAFTNTYAPAARLETLFTEAMEDEEVEVLSIATRPDCLPDGVLELLGKLNQRKPVWIELGLQTASEKTAGWIRRGYPLSCFTEARQHLGALGIPVIAHVIIGLPGEGEAGLLKTIDYLNEQAVEGVKLQLLHILKGTGLEALYRTGEVRALSFEEYETLLFAAIRRLRPETVIHRITGDGPKRLLIAPLWSGNKKMVLNTLHRDMKMLGIRQGMDFKRRY
ncbi:MAG TPA: TIGR01212 family radical SAM protein [Firmicutes bacterium]|nr:TIGR01212 family radical SAM protein [Bacillota bacterium]